MLTILKRGKRKVAKNNEMSYTQHIYLLRVLGDIIYG